MKKRLLVLVMCGLVLCSGCGKSENKESEKVVAEMKTKSISLETNVMDIEELAASIGKKPCYVSEREVCENTNDFPVGVCTDFSYFSYDAEKSPYVAQQYLEAIGVSKENEKLVVKCIDDEEVPKSLVFLEYDFEGDVTRLKEHHFSSNQNLYEKNLDEFVGVIHKSNKDAFYVTTTFREVSLSYDRVMALDEDGEGYEIIW